MESLEEKFSNPPREYRPVPWWTWTGELKEGEMEWQLREMLDKGIYEFFIFPVYGLEVEYCSEEWWKKIEFALKRSKELGMKVWIYDDYNWPSGTCAGFILRDEPWTRNVGMGYKVRKVRKSEEVQVEVVGELVVVQGVNETGEVREVRDYILEGHSICWRNETGKDCKLVIFNLERTEELYPYASGAPWTWNQRGYIDTLNGKAMRKFLEYTHEQYYKRFKEHFPETIVGFFTDEPWAGGSPFPYTEELFEKFQDKYGYDLKERLSELVLDIGDYLRTRYDYWALVSELFSTNYTKLIYDWCEEHQVKSTGHLLGEEALQMNVLFYGDIYEAAKWMQVPGIDILENATGYEPPLGGVARSIYSGFDLRAFNVTAKLLSSTARHAGRNRVLSEAFGVYTWGLTLQEMKKGTDWHTALGVNLINDNLLPYCIEGFRKRKISGKAFTVPYWKYYKHYSDYCGRLCLMDAEGTLKAEVAVLYPRTSAWCLLNSEALEGKSEAWQKMQESLYAVTDALLRTHWCWEFVFEPVLMNTKVENGKLLTDNASYSAIILPSVSVLSRGVFEKLKEFVQSKGLLIALEVLPSRSPDKGWDIQKEVAEIFEENNAILLGGLEDGDELEKELDTILSSQLGKPVEIRGEGARKIIMAHRIHRSKGIQTIFLSNQAKEPAEARIKVNLEGNLELWNPSNGQRFSAGGTKELNYHFRGYESVFLVVKEKDSQNLPNLKDKLFQYQHTEREIQLSEDWEFRTNTPNMLLLDWQVKLDPEGKGMEEEWYEKVTYAQELQRRSGEDEGWLKAESDKIEAILDPEEIAFYWLRSKIKFNFIPENLALVVDSQEFEDLWVNGQKIVDFEPATLWDRANIKFKLNKHVKRGVNTFVFRVRPSKYYSKNIRGDIIDPTFLEPVVLLGDFVVERHNGLYEISQFQGTIKAGFWHLQGFPHYAGLGIYQQRFRVPQLRGRFWLDLGDLRDAVEIWINDELAGICLWSPYYLEVTKFLYLGENTLTLKIANTFGNFLRPYYMGIATEPVPSGLLSQPKIVQTKG